jgi:Ni/Co efflux regulator RcnB
MVRTQSFPIATENWTMGLSRKLMITLVAAATTFTTLTPAMAMPLPAPDAERRTDVRTVQYREHYRDRDRRWDRHRHRHGWYGGHRGYRDYRRGYRRHSDGWWYPLAAFGAGAVIGGAIANNREPRVVKGGIDPRHYDWCASRFRTYRAADNTYIPYVGAVAECRSPYY